MFRRLRLRPSTLPVGVFIALFLTGCGGSSSAGSAAPTPAQPPTHPIIVSHPGGHPDAFYNPDPIRIRVGQTITWTNKDNEAHDATALNGAFDSRPIAFGASYRWKALRAGTYRYFCTLHPDMHGTVVVRSGP